MDKKRKVKRFVEWGRVWEEFDNWFEQENPKCTQCGHINMQREWDEQVGKIEDLVEAQLAIKR